ncbi:hypothetical protein AAE02nite_39720 [Adhaeribacter aerolatus]|uniref:DUF2905 domain-containing protein n=1 Tax=Adhaeribacter aerolatus TaxID=670289 RepID=A0A512B2X0_9BACT|nr:DUF2905 domain-containing protein [Adhaeribacter aerolatus]GEO06308.1 hypothetical protein AAE02nite_39720 [Adhaeribacter aerolatus]
MQPIGKILVLVGLGIVFIGLLIWLFGNKLNWFGNLPGDIRIERPNFKFYAPIMSMLLLSIFISLVLWVIRRLF